jgi:hypothetical protein
LAIPAPPRRKLSPIAAASLDHLVGESEQGRQKAEQELRSSMQFEEKSRFYSEAFNALALGGICVIRTD